jgi:DNA-binding NarL/FixJ family response regulator
MMSLGARILCIDSSSLRLREITEVLKKANFEVWTARGASDAMCLTAGLHFDALAVDQASTQVQPEVWRCLAETQPELPVLVHSAQQKSGDPCRKLELPQTSPRISEVVLALLLLLLGKHPLRQARAA